uniref:Ankyrin repeat and LEM domain containing 1 n=1 Tax=Chelonoidis abingdonii TaxID=106734 RepID=A0A8C0IMG4_CHEAB
KCGEVVEALLKQGADPNLVLPEGIAAIHLAAGKERESGVRCLKLILQYGGNPNARSVEELTPLHVAASWGCYKCLKLLLRNGGDPNLEDQDGNRAIDLALEQGNKMCVQILQGFQHAWLPEKADGAHKHTLYEPGNLQPKVLQSLDFCCGGVSWEEVIAACSLARAHYSTLPSHLWPTLPCLIQLYVLSLSPPPPFLGGGGKRAASCTGTGHSPELASVLETFQIPDCKDDEMALSRQFDQPDKNRKWREGVLKSSFNYLLLDPRVTQNLPFRCHRLSQADCFRTFISAVFYVGKGKRSRPYSHLYQALTHYKGGKKQACPKVQHILDIWAGGQGVISVHCFQNVIPVEAYTREACLVDAIGTMLTNQKKGNYYGVVASWPMKRRRCLGIHMLHRAMQIFLAEGERQLRPADIQIGQ